MSKKLGVLFAVAVAMLLLPGSASAHVLIKDTQNGTGAILHVNPDDDPIAGERASLFFDIKDSSIIDSSARLTITNEKGEVTLVSSSLTGTGVSASYIFSSQGQYNIKLEIEKEGRTTHTFLQTQRVSRGIISSIPSSNTPAWAQAGMVFTSIAAVVMAIVAFNRRQIIRKYSKF